MQSDSFLVCQGGSPLIVRGRETTSGGRRKAGAPSLNASLYVGGSHVFLFFLLYWQFGAGHRPQAMLVSKSHANSLSRPLTSWPGPKTLHTVRPSVITSPHEIVRSGSMPHH